MKGRVDNEREKEIVRESSIQWSISPKVHNTQSSARPMPGDCNSVQAAHIGGRDTSHLRHQLLGSKQEPELETD